MGIGHPEPRVPLCRRRRGRHHRRCRAIRGERTDKPRNRAGDLHTGSGGCDREAHWLRRVVRLGPVEAGRTTSARTGRVAGEEGVRLEGGGALRGRPAEDDRLVPRNKVGYAIFDGRMMGPSAKDSMLARWQLGSMDELWKKPRERLGVNERMKKKAWAFVPEPMKDKVFGYA